MVFILQSQASKNCDIQDWRPRHMLMLRANELAVFEITSNFNEYNTLGLVCITQKSDLSLLDKLALDYDQMRQERVILWMQVNVTGNLLRKISKQLEKHHFTKVLLVEIVNRKNVTYNIHRLNAFPKAKFERIDNLSQVGDIYPRSLTNFQGRNTLVLPKKNAFFKSNVSYGPKKYFPISTSDDILIIEFARKYNLSLELSTKTLWDHFDMQLTPRLISRVEFAECVNPFTFVSLVAVVPCGKELGVQEVFKQLDFGLVLRYLLPVYVAFVVVESFIRLIKARIHNETHRFSYLDPVANMRAVSAILGMPFPVSRRWNSSLRQLFLVLSIFGFVLSNFFACKLSSHLTKRSRCHEIKKLEELRDSGLDVMVERGICHYVLTAVPKTEAAPLSLHHFYWVWTLLFLGYAFATLVFCIELCLKRE
nr:uncharacterized protein LOC108130264 [Drosophila bipectinata]